MASDFVRQSIIAPYIDGLIREKHAAGYSYKSQELVLNRFDTYCVGHGLESPEITKNFLSEWIEQTETEGASNQAKRISCVRQLLMYMAACGIQVYIPHDFCHFKRSLPHIFTKMEIAAFFRELDAYQPERSRAVFLRLNGEYRMVFRLYCCCGLRNSEAAGIAMENVDLDKGVLTIMDSKGNKDRLVYLPDDLQESCREYYRFLCECLSFHPKWLFPGMDPHKPLPNSSIDAAFERIWKRTPYAGCNNKPTVHDFRFTFVVNRMNAWAEAGLDLQVMMPYLSRYLGHKTTKETFYYYYLVNDAYKTVAKKDTIARDVIPEVK